MLLLLDASFFEGVIALMTDDKVVREERIRLGPLAEDDLAVLLKSFLEEKEIEGFALGIGPGSYTGMRVAASLILSLAYARSLPLLTFSSLEGVSSSGEAVLVDGKRGNFYLLDQGEVRLVSLSEVPKSLRMKSPQPLKKMVPGLQDYEIEEEAFQPSHLLNSLSKKRKNSEFTDPLKVKLQYFQ